MQATPFPKLVITNVQYLVDRRFMSLNRPSTIGFIVPSRVFGLGDERVATVEEALEVVFRQCNHVDGTELVSEPEWSAAHPHVRSMSVGDVVTFRGPGGWRKDFVCEGSGWTELSREDAEWLVRNVSPRDYFGSFAEVKARLTHPVSAY